MAKHDPNRRRLRGFILVLFESRHPRHEEGHLASLCCSLRGLEHLLHGERAFGLANHANDMSAFLHVELRRNPGALCAFSRSCIFLESSKN